MDGLSDANDFLEELSALSEGQPRSNLVVTFSTDAIENPAKTKAAGRPVFEDVEMIEIRVPGDRDFIRHPATDDERRQFARQYLAFRKSQTQEAVDGFPLAQWAVMKKAEVEEARVMGVHTVEQLAGVPDSFLQRFGPGWLQKRQHARDWEASAKSGAETVKLRAQVDALSAHVKTLEGMLAKQAQELHRDSTLPPGAVAVVSPADEKIARLEAMVEKLAATPTNGAPKRRGRPPKAKPESQGA